MLLLTAKDRTRYLDSTIKSVLATLPDPALLSIGCDTISQQSIDYLTTANNIYLGTDYSYPNDNPDWAKRIGFIENKTEVVGLDNQVRVLPTPQCFGHDSLLAYLLMVLELHEKCTHIILIEDDVIFKKDWHQKLCASLACHDDCGLIAGFRYPIYTTNRIVAPDITFFDGYYSAVCLGLSAKLIKNMTKGGFRYNRRAMVQQDNWIVGQCVRLGMRKAYLNSGVCQHIGLKSATWEGSQAKPYFNNQNCLGRIDKAIMPPFELGN